MRQSSSGVVTLVVALVFTTVRTSATPFEKGTFSLSLEGAYTSPIRFSTNEFITGSGAVGYFLIDNWSVWLRGEGMHVNQDFGFNDADGGGAGVLLRWHMFNFDRFSVYADGGGGLSWFNEAVPTGGTTYNFTARVGGGLAYRVADDLYLMGGARYFHLSNANQHGRIKNPSYDGIEWYVGVMMMLK